MVFIWRPFIDKGPLGAASPPDHRLEEQQVDGSGCGRLQGKFEKTCRTARLRLNLSADDADGAARWAALLVCCLYFQGLRALYLERHKVGLGDFPVDLIFFATHDLTISLIRQSQDMSFAPLH